MTRADDLGQAVRRWVRWRLRGAWLWPTFVVVTTLEAMLLHWLPIAGDGTGLVPGLLLAGTLNVAAVALLGGLGGRLLRRFRRDLPKVVADDYSGMAALGIVAAAFVTAGLVHRPQLGAERAAFTAQSTAVRRWVDAHGDAFARAHVARADTIRLDEDLYRTCVPERAPSDRICLVIDTSHSPPRVRRDRSRESNASQDPHGVYR